MEFQLFAKYALL